MWPDCLPCRHARGDDIFLRFQEMTSNVSAAEFLDLCAQQERGEIRIFTIFTGRTKTKPELWQVIWKPVIKPPVQPELEIG